MVENIAEEESYKPLEDKGSSHHQMHCARPTSLSFQDQAWSVRINASNHCNIIRTNEREPQTSNLLNNLSAIMDQQERIIEVKTYNNSNLHIFYLYANKINNTEADDGIKCQNTFNMPDNLEHAPSIKCQNREPIHAKENKPQNWHHSST